MELKELLPFVLVIVAVGILIGIGVTVTEHIGTASHKNQHIINESIYLVNNTATPLLNGNLTSFVGLKNGSQSVIPVANVTVALVNGTVEFDMAGFGNSTCGAGKVCYATYYYDEYDTAAAGAMGSVATEVGGISTNWVSLIVICFVAGLILTLVMSNFQQRR